MYTFSSTRESGSTRGFVTTDPERQGVPAMRRLAPASPRAAPSSAPLATMPAEGNKPIEVRKPGLRSRG
ncbi:MAG TPA: hypothetical protein VFH35_11050 [Ramlibacter sp.]|nr:hypothetical protein [Ramlibacter sp.]